MFPLMRWCLIFLLLVAPILRAQDADPAVAVTDDTWHDAARERDIPVRIYAPKTSSGPVPVIIFSHGLGGSREGYSYVGNYWAAHGFISVHVQHPGSDSGLLKTGQPMQAAKKAMTSPDNLINRPKDISFAIDQLTALNAASGPWHNRFDLNRIGVAGHSFGAYTTMAIAGEHFPMGRSGADPRVKAVVAMSTPSPGALGTAGSGYDTVRIPALHFTGTEDKIAIIGTDSVEKRRIPFDQSPGPDTYLVIFTGANHMTFGGPSHRFKARNNEIDTNAQRLICEGSTAFWNAYLKDDAAAKQWLQGGGFAQAIGSAGTLEKK